MRFCWAAGLASLGSVAVASAMPWCGAGWWGLVRMPCDRLACLLASIDGGKLMQCKSIKNVDKLCVRFCAQGAGGIENPTRAVHLTVNRACLALG